MNTLQSLRRINDAHNALVDLDAKAQAWLADELAKDPGADPKELGLKLAQLVNGRTHGKYFPDKLRSVVKTEVIEGTQATKELYGAQS